MELSEPVPVGSDVIAELQQATAVHQDAQEAAGAHAQRFRAAVVAAIDAGVSQNIVAGLAGVSPARVHAIVVREYSRG